MKSKKFKKRYNRKEKILEKKKLIKSQNAKGSKKRSKKKIVQNDVIGKNR